MDTSTSGKPKGGTPNRPLTSRLSLSKSTKTGSPTQSPRASTESPQPAISRGVGLIPKVGTAVKEVNAVKSNNIRTVAASPIKSKTVTHKDSASPLKAPAKQTTRPQSGEKGAQQMASLLVTKNETAKKTAEGALLIKPKGGQEAGSTTPSKRSGTVKREVGKLPEYGSVPKDKTLCLRPESSAPVASKPLATASSPNKTLKASSMSSPKSKQIVPQPEKPVTAISLSTKATKSPLSSTRQGAITSTTAKQVKTASPLAKTPRPTSVLTKVAKTLTSPVKPVNTSAPIMSRSAIPVKPPGNTLSATNQAKVGKRSITNKATSASAKPVNNVPTTIKSVKSSTVDSKSVKLDCTEAATVKEVNQNLPEVAKVKMNTTEKMVKLDKPQESPIIENEMAALPVNIVRENTTVDDAMNGGKHLESKLPLDRNESISLTEKNLVENHSQDNETQPLPSLTPQVKSLAKQFIPLEEEVSDLVKEESSTELDNPLYEGQKSKKPSEEPLNVPSKHIQETLSAPETHFIMEEIKPFKEETRDLSEHLQEELGSNTELAINSDHSDNVHGKVHILNKSVSDELASSIQPSKTVEFLSKENRSLDKDQMVYVDEVTYLNQLERMPMQSLDEETFTVECVEPLEDAITSSLEQVTPLEEGILSEDELECMEQKYTMLKVEKRNSPEILDKLETSPGEPHNPLDVITSSTEELTPSEEEAVLLKHEKQMVQEISPSENLDMENVTSKIDVAKTTEIATLSVEPVIHANEKANTLEEPFGETIINAEGKHTEKGNIQSSDLLQSSAEEIRISEELMSEGPLHSSFNDNITQCEDLTSTEAMQTSVEEVKLSEKEPLLSVESVEYSVETVKFPHEDQIFSVEPLQDLLEDIKSSQEAMSTVEPCQTSGDEVKHLQDCLLMETLQSSVEDVFSSPKNLSSPLLLNASLEPLNPLEENLLSSFDKLTEPKESITSMEGISRLERSQSPVQLQDLSQHLVSLENTKELAHEFRADGHNVSSEKEEIPLMPQGHLIEQFNSILQPTQHDAEIFDASFVKSSEKVEQSIKSANIDPVGSELFEEPSHMIYDPDHGTPEHVNAGEKLDSVEAGVEYICNPIKLGQSVQKSVLFPEEPLASIEAFKTTSVEATASPEKPIISLLERVNWVDNVEKSTKPSIHELMCSKEDLTTSLEKSLDIAMFTPSEDIGICSSEPVDISTNVPTLLNYLEHLEKIESKIPLTVEDNAFVETSVEPQLNKPSIHVLTPLDSLESVETPIKHEVSIKSVESQDETNMLDPNTEEANYPLQVNQPEELESLTLENQHKTTLELVTNLEKTSDSDFYVTTDPIVVKKCSPKQSIKEDIKENNRHTTADYVLNEPISFTGEEYLVPSDNATNIVEYTIPFKGTIPATELIEVGFSTESTSICHTFSPATNTIFMPPAEQNVEVRETINLSTQLQKVDAHEHPQETEREPWVVVKMEELLDFKEEQEERLLRPASLNQDAEVQDEQKAEEELVERASVCSTLSDPQLAAKSSSETSTPEELRTYEDSSSGVESHSDDAPTSLQTTLTPDPDLGIHMGQEEGTDTPVGTPASNNKGIPLPLQIVDIEGQSQSTSPSGISDSSEINPIVRKKEMTASTESKEHDYEQRDKEKGAQRGNDD